MATLRLEIEVRDYDLWRGAFERDAEGRQQAGMRCYRIFRPVDDPHRVMVDADFDRAEEAQAFPDIMRTKVWPDPEKAPAKVGAPGPTSWRWPNAGSTEAHTVQSVAAPGSLAGAEISHGSLTGWLDSTGP